MKTRSIPRIPIAERFLQLPGGCTSKNTASVGRLNISWHLVAFGKAIRIPRRVISRQVTTSHLYQNRKIFILISIGIRCLSGPLGRWAI